jgi:starvation-inducible DNA-binding protein
MKKPTARKQDILDRVRPLRNHDEREIQPFSAIAKLPIALAEDVCKASVDNLNQLIADTMTLRDMYKNVPLV